MTIVLDGTNGISTPDLESSGPVTGTTGTFSGNVTLGSSVLATPVGSAPSYTCRAWVNFNGTGTVAIRGSGNVSSITDNGTGNYTVNFTNAMPDANYGFQGTANKVAGSFNCQVTMVGTPTTSACQFLTQNDGNDSQADATFVSIAIFR